MPDIVKTLSEAYNNLQSYWQGYEYNDNVHANNSYDFFSHPYQANNQQVEYITHAISAFKNINNKCITYDTKVGACIAAEILLLYVTGFLGPINFTALSGALLWYVFPVKERIEDYKQMSAQLDTLIKVYQHCLDSNYPSLIKDNKFLDLLEAIAPFVKTSSLKLDKLNFSKDAPQRVCEILSREPHNLKFVLPDQQAMKELLRLYSDDKQNLYCLFNKGKANLQRLAYGPTLREEISRRMAPK